MNKMTLWLGSVALAAAAAVANAQTPAASHQAGAHARTHATLMVAQP